MKNTLTAILAGLLVLGLLVSTPGANAQVPNSANPKDIALAPQQNDCRNVLSLSGLWNFQTDPEDIGELEGWQNGLSAGQPIAVPGSWNEQISGLKHYSGHVWYEKTFTVPSTWKNERIFLRVNGAAYASKVYVNGELVGTHQGGSLPFAFEVGQYVTVGKENLVAIVIENELEQTRIPVGNIKGGYVRQDPNTAYDFFPYGGLQRDVLLYTVPSATSLRDVAIVPSFEGNTGWLDIALEVSGKASKATVTVTAPGKEAVTGGVTPGGTSRIELPDVTLWDTENPFLYNVKVDLYQGSKVVDSYTVATGVRTIATNGASILLNGKSIQIRGFGKHEDYPIFGRGKALPVSVKDFQLMKWCGANSFRTSHYPYDESVYELADRMGILIIDEIPAVGLIFNDGEANIALRKSVCDQMLEEMITRDKNHPSVVMWSVANEPTSNSGNEYVNGVMQESEENHAARVFLTALMNQARALDPSRLATFVQTGTPANWGEESDVVCINRYYGWYSHVGDMEGALKALSDEIDELSETYDKPIIVSEFGADTVPGNHSEYREMFSEEFQCDFIASYLDVANTKPAVAGMMIWNFADFHTGQAIHRVDAHNLKGVFTIDRRPKMAAYLLHDRWFGKEGY